MSFWGCCQELHFLVLADLYLLEGLESYSHAAFSRYWATVCVWSDLQISFLLKRAEFHLPPAYCRLATLSLIAVVQQKPGQWLILVKAKGPSI